MQWEQSSLLLTFMHWQDNKSTWHAVLATYCLMTESSPSSPHDMPYWPHTAWWQSPHSQAHMTCHIGHILLDDRVLTLKPTWHAILATYCLMTESSPSSPHDMPYWPHTAWWQSPHPQAHMTCHIGHILLDDRVLTLKPTWHAILATYCLMTESSPSSPHDMPYWPHTAWWQSPHSQAHVTLTWSAPVTCTEVMLPKHQRSTWTYIFIMWCCYPVPP